MVQDDYGKKKENGKGLTAPHQYVAYTRSPIATQFCKSTAEGYSERREFSRRGCYSLQAGCQDVVG